MIFYVSVRARAQNSASTHDWKKDCWHITNQSPYAYGDSPYAYGEEGQKFCIWGVPVRITCTHMGSNIHVTPCMRTTSLCVRAVPICNFLPFSPFAYGESPYVYRDQILTCQQAFLESRVKPDLFKCAHQNMWLNFINPCMHMGMTVIPLCIRRVTLIPVCVRGLPKKWSLCAYGDLRDARMHTGMFQSLTICIWEIFPYEKSSLVSPYANFPIQALPYAYRDPRMHMGRDC